MIVLKMAWRNIWRNRRRTAITIASIFFAVVLSSLMMSLKEGMYAHMIDSSIGAYNGFVQVNTIEFSEDKLIDNSFALDENITTILNGHENIRGYIPRIEYFSLAAYGEKTRGSLVVGTDMKKEKNVTNITERVYEGELITQDDDGVLVGKGMADYLQLGVGDTIVLIGQGYHGTCLLYTSPSPRDA